MDLKSLTQLLESVANGAVSASAAAQQIKKLPFEDIGYAHIDHHRSLRKGFPEVIFGEGKSDEHIIGIMESMASQERAILVTRVHPAKAEKILSRFPAARYHSNAAMITFEKVPVDVIGKKTILVISAGTSDIPVAEEACITAETMGNRVESVFDVGVAGIHRLLGHMSQIESAGVLVVVAGMEGALPSVVAGLVDKPVIAVPTSVGYGVSLGGLTALFAMLNSCASNVAVVNIDNGFGAGYMAAIINRE
jgi:NCAIR mutase (PurE)-related protein